MKYRVLFLGYWNLDDPLTQSTIFPNLIVLKGLSKVESLHLVNAQREKPSIGSQKELKKLEVAYHPIYSKNFGPNLLNKILDFFLFPYKIKQYCQENQINLIIARGAPSGALAVKSTKKSKIPFIVESFEPHAEYMRYSGTWKTYDPRYIFQNKWEEQVKLKAKFLLTVSQNYKNQLIEEGVEEDRLEVVPCGVNLNQFYPDKGIKVKMRRQLDIPLGAIVGVYAGKFGNLYYDKEAFQIFRESFSRFDNFFLLLLTSESDIFVAQRLEQFGIPKNRVIKKFVSHSEMPHYLNVADFAYATIKNITVSRFQSPVKIAEYWATGLPVLLTEGVGDESDYLEKEKGGVLIRDYSPSILNEVVLQMKELLNSSLKSNHYVALAKKYRSFAEVEIKYKKIF